MRTNPVVRELKNKFSKINRSEPAHDRRRPFAFPTNRGSRRARKNTPSKPGPLLSGRSKYRRSVVRQRKIYTSFENFRVPIDFIPEHACLRDEGRHPEWKVYRARSCREAQDWRAGQTPRASQIRGPSRTGGCSIARLGPGVRCFVEKMKADRVADRPVIEIARPTIPSGQT